ncbi:MAG: helicase-exonuclease AddAB subunit AddA [Lachnospiraceae bacterium]|nr:helicase-exonuclease AddAB subunit AddA [Lachnospiraceae bacterium]
MKWNQEQLEIINGRGKNLLVSAAAGAGKTTVMIERILGLMVQEPDGIDIDRFLIVTFTRDAAANMREKLNNRLSELIDKDPSNKRLTRQQMLLQNAKITTLDSFCGSVVREFFYRVDIDPSFRMGDNAETALIRTKVLDELLESKYTKAEDGFLCLVESYCGTKNDSALNNLVSKMAKSAYAQAWPFDWLDQLENEISLDMKLTGLRPEWKSQIVDICHLELNKAAAYSAKAVKLMTAEMNRLLSLQGANSKEDRLKKILQTLQVEQQMIMDIQDEDDYSKLGVRLSDADFGKLTIGNVLAEDVKDEITDKRNAYKKKIRELAQKWFLETEEEQVSTCAGAAKPMLELIELTKEYLRELLKKKKEKNVFEFSDISHFALEILASKDENGGFVPTEAALELRERFHDIFIDEYQDSDSVQEQIAEIIAGASGTAPYTFMVGDVKQSIYKFRMARPELFIERATRYESDPSQGRLNRLGFNYRSSRSVIDSVNDVFRLCMHEEVGKVEYSPQAELVCGKIADEPQNEEGIGNNGDDVTEIIIAEQNEDTEDSSTGITGEGTDTDGPDEPGGSHETVSETEEYTASGLCAKAAAKRIRQLLDEGYPIAVKDGGFRKCEYRDFVILLRSTKAFEYYREELEKLGISVFADSGQGFLGSYEIGVVVDYLRLLDNPYQDIPLVSVLASEIGGMSDDDLVSIRVYGGLDIPFWNCLVKYSQDGPDVDLRTRCAGFLKIFNDIRKMNMSRDIDKVIFSIYEKTGFFLYCLALPYGQSRASNLEMLLSYASQYEKVGSYGLFDFVSYIEEITKAQDDLEEAVSSEASNAVRIMTIHKSKGLEFPIVIIGDAAKQFNQQDRNAEVIISPDYGIAAKYIDLNSRTKHNTIRRILVSKKLEQDTIGEELRLLYVAMTRAMQKLIIIGSPGKKGKKETDWVDEAAIAGPNGRYPDSYVASSGAYMDLVYPAALINKDDFVITGYHVSDNDENAGKKESLERKESFLSVTVKDEDKDQKILNELEYHYERDAKEALPIKLSVSDIKHECMTEEGVLAPFDGDVVRLGSGGAALGDLYHKVMRFIPLGLKDRDEVELFLKTLDEEEDAKLTRDEKKLIDPERIAHFLQSGLCERMRKASGTGQLWREQQFMLGMKACEIDPVKYAGRNELIPVQGVIDCFFEEEDGMVILDYKTDALPADGLTELVKRYHSQLELYAKAISELMGERVKEGILYSFSLEEAVCVDTLLQ